MDQISKTLGDRQQFVRRLGRSLDNTCSVAKQTEEHVKKLEDTIKNIKELGKKPEHIAIIPLANNIYLKAKIMHTGEYVYGQTGSPNSYLVLKTLDQTVQSLEDAILEQRDSLKKLETTKEQLKKRVNLMSGTDSLKMDDTEETIQSEVIDEMPQRIHSEKGIAVKVGGFYEIIEYED